MMRLSRFFLPTLHQAPAEAADASHRLLLRAGMLRALGDGGLAYLPLGQQVRRRIAAHGRQVLDAMGGQEIALPPLAVAAEWAGAGRPPESLAPLSPSPAALITTLVRHDLRSHRSLPLLLYGFRPRFREEAPAGPGPLAARQGLALESFFLHADAAGLEQGQRDLEAACGEILRRCGLSAGLARADYPGEEPAADLFIPAVPGQEPFVRCPRCGYVAELHRARRAKEPGPPEEMRAREEVLTPGCQTIAELAAFLGVPEDRTSKAVFLAGGGCLVFAVVRGDMDVDEVKLARLLGRSGFRPARENEIVALGAAPGFASPIGIRRDGPLPVVIVVDDLVPLSPNLVAGANRADVHLRNVNYGRDYQGDLVADIVAVRAGDPCPNCRAPLEPFSTTVLARLWAPGTRLSRRQGAMFQDAAGEERLPQLACAEIDVDRLLAACVEVHHDEAGIRWPAGLAPYAVHLLTIGGAPEVVEAADALYAGLQAAGFDVLYDDRDMSAGSKFVEADLLGMPLRVAVSKRTVADGAAEVKRRDQPRESVQVVALERVPSWVRGAMELVKKIGGNDGGSACDLEDRAAV